MSPPIAPLPSAAKHLASSSALFGLKGFEFANLFFDDTSMAFDAWYVVVQWITAHYQAID
jgi:hypothetical protein